MDEVEESGEWVDKMPIAGRGKGGGQVYNWEGIAAKLKQRPGKWRRVLENVPRSHASDIRAGGKPQFQPPEDWLVRTVGPRGYLADLYMVYIGTPGAKAKALAAIEK